MAVEFVADFETTSIRVYNIKDKKLNRQLSEAWVCAWALIPVEIDPDPLHIIHGRTIASFMAALEETVRQLSPREQKRGISLFTHNLKFDGDFIMYWLLSTGAGHIEDEIRENVLYSFAGVWNDIRVVFRDSLKIFPKSADEVGNMYGIKKLKGSWDYDKYRDENTEISAKEWEYVDHDVMIISKAIADYRSRGYKENTQASIAYNERLRRTFPQFNKTTARRLKNFNYEKFRRCFPWQIRPLALELHRHYIEGYFGGITYLNPMYACIDMTNTPAYDVHSMYPGHMFNSPLPVGDPLIIDNPSPEYAEKLLRDCPCIIADFEDLTIKLKGPEYFPCMMFSTDSSSSVRMQGKVIRCCNESAVLTGLDYEMLKSEYDIISGKIVRLHIFKYVVGLYKDFIEYWMGIKSDSDKIRTSKDATPDEKRNAKVNREIAKLMMNSSYGKDGTKLIRETKTTYLDEETGLLEAEPKYEIADVEYYLPSAIFITAHARRQLWKAVKACRHDGISEFIYCDTDSVKVTQKGEEMLKADPDFVIDDYKLGTWGYEGKYLTARFVRQKTYTYEQFNDDGELERHFTVCGAPSGIKSLMKIDEFLPGMKIPLEDVHKCVDEEGKPLEGKLLPVRVKGGIILEETGFQISELDNWDMYSGVNMPIDYEKLKEVLY